MEKEKILELANQAGEKAIEDLKFRQDLVSDANAAIKKEYGEELPTKLTFHEFSDKKLVFVLPEPAATEELDGELSDDMLDAVSGGSLGSSLLNDKTLMIGGYACYPTILGSGFGNLKK